MHEVNKKTDMLRHQTETQKLQSEVYIQHFEGLNDLERLEVLMILFELFIFQGEVMPEYIQYI